MSQHHDRAIAYIAQGLATPDARGTIGVATHDHEDAALLAGAAIQMAIALATSLDDIAPGSVAELLLVASTDTAFLPGINRPAES